MYRATVLAPRGVSDRRLCGSHFGSLADAAERIREAKSEGGLVVLRTPYAQICWRVAGQTKKQAARLLEEYDIWR